MKKCSTFWGFCLYFSLFFSFLFTPSLEATPLSLFGPDETWLRVGITNDLLAGDMPLNIDDWRSFGFWARIGLPYNLDLSLENYGLTNRAEQLRIDEINMALTFWQKFSTHYGVFDLLPGLGFRIYGNYGGELVQNLTHTIIDVPHLEFSYLGGGFAEYMEGLALLGFTYTYPIELLDSFFLHPYLRANLEVQIPWGMYSQFLSGISLLGSGGERYEFTAGWAQRHTGQDAPELFAMLEKEEGFFLAYALQSGFFRYELSVFPNTHFANGTIAVVFYDKPSRKRKEELSEGLVPVIRPSYKESHLISEFSMDAIQKTKQIGLFVPLGKGQDIGSFFGKNEYGKKLSFLAGLSYRFGELMQFSQEGELPRFVAWTGETQCRLGPFIPSFPVDFVLGLGAGYWHIYYFQRPIIEKSEQGFFLSSKLGLTTKPFALFPKSPLFSPTSRYAFSLDYGPRFLFQEGELDFVHSINIGISVHTDLRG